MDIQRLRNLTTRRLHTKMGHVYEDLEIITGETGLMTHMLPQAAQAVEPWLRDHVTDQRFWDGKYDTTHTGELELPTPSEADRKAMFERYTAQPNQFAGKQVIFFLYNAEAHRERPVCDASDSDQPTGPRCGGAPC